MFHLKFKQNKKQPEDTSINNEKEEENTCTQRSEITSSIKLDKTNAVQLPPIQKENPPENIVDENSEHQPFVYEFGSALVVFRRMSENYAMRCPHCHFETRYIVQHLTKKVDCTKSIYIDEFKDQLKIFKSDHTKAVKRKADQLCKNKQRVENAAKVKERQTKWKDISRTRQRAEGEDKVKE